MILYFYLVYGELKIKDIVVDPRSFLSSMISVVIVMIIQGIVSPHISLRVLEHEGLLWVSLLTFGFMIARSFSSILHAVLYEKYSARITGVIGLSLIVSCYILYMYIPVYLYPLIKLLEGFASGLFWPLMQSILVESVSPQWRSRMLSIYFLLGNVSGYLGYQIGSIIYLMLGPQNIVLSGTVLLITYTIIYYILTPKKQAMKRFKPRQSISFTTVLSEARRLKHLLPLMILVGGVNGLLKDYVFAYVKILTGYSEPVLRNYWSIIGYIGLTLSIVFSHIYEALHREKTVLTISTIFTASITLLFFLNNPILIMITLSLVIVGTRTLRPLLRGIASKYTTKPEYGIALVNSISNISAGVVPVLIALSSFMI